MQACAVKPSPHVLALSTPNRVTLLPAPPDPPLPPSLPCSHRNDLALAEACREDVDKLCVDVPEDEILACLHRNRTALSDACRFEETRMDVMQVGGREGLGLADRHACLRLCHAPGLSFWMGRLSHAAAPVAALP